MSGKVKFLQFIFLYISCYTVFIFLLYCLFSKKIMNFFLILPVFYQWLIMLNFDFFICNVILPERQRQPGAVFQLCPVTQSQYVPV